MKLFICSKILIASLFSLFIFNSYAQKSDKKELTKEEQEEISRQQLANRSSEESKHIASAYLSMIQSANDSYINANTKTCNAFNYIKSLKQENIVSSSFTDEAYHWMVQKFLDIGYFEHSLEGTFDKGVFKTIEDKLLHAYSTSTDFGNFVFRFTEKNIGDLSKKDQESLREKYTRFKNPVDIHLNDMDGGVSYIKNENGCIIRVDNFIRKTKYRYPNVEWLFTSKITHNCLCDESSNATTLNKATYEYTSKVTSVYTATEIVFNSSVKDAKLSITNVICCPQKTEKTASATPTEESSSFIKDTRDIFLNPNSVNDYKEYVTTEWGNSQEKKDNNTEGGFFREAGSFAYGVYLGNTVGKEKDFYGLTYGTELAYYQKLTDDFLIGVTVGYTGFSGKETDFGFETESESYIPLMVKARYNISDAFGVEAGLGYAISASEGGEGGVSYSTGPFWKPLEAVLFAINYVNIAFGEGSLGALMLSGSVSLSKK